MSQADRSLARLLFDAGLIQFGWFEHDDAVQPVAVHLEMIASFPDILSRIVEAAAARLELSGYERLLGTPDAIPFATAVSLASGVPLVYSRGMAEPASVDLVGAYDGGHPALLVANAVGLGRDLPSLVSKARRVGLEVNTLLAILEVRAVPSFEGVRIVPLLRLGAVVSTLNAEGLMPPRHAQAVLIWIATST